MVCRKELKVSIIDGRVGEDNQNQIKNTFQSFKFSIFMYISISL